MRPKRIEIVGVTKTFRRIGGQSITPVDNVSLVLEERETVVLLGPSGCGKTTLLRCVAGLEQPSAGEIIIDGRIVFSAQRKISLPPNERRLSMVFQSYALWPHMTVAQNVEFPLRNSRVPAKERAKTVAEILDLVGIAHLAKQFPGRLSGGQQQRVSLARALVNGGGLILFDEPLSNVDALVRTQLRSELKRMQRAVGFSALYVTHDQAEALDLGHRIAILEAGRIAALGEPETIYRRPNSEYVASFLGSANIWSADVATVGRDLAELEAPFGRVLASTDGQDLRRGHAKIVVRPERLHISADKISQCKNAFAGEIVNRTFSGSHVEYLVKCAGADARSLTQAIGHPQFSEGQQVWIHFDPADAQVLT